MPPYCTNQQMQKLSCSRHMKFYECSLLWRSAIGRLFVQALLLTKFAQSPPSQGLTHISQTAWHFSLTLCQAIGNANAHNVAFDGVRTHTVHAVSSVYCTLKLATFLLTTLVRLCDPCHALGFFMSPSSGWHELAIVGQEQLKFQTFGQVTTMCALYLIKL